MLRATAIDPEWPDWSAAVTDLSLRLALFEPRFGMRAEACDGWVLLQEPASVLVGRIRELTADWPAVLGIDLGRGHCPLFYDLAMLLELTGDLEGAGSLLFAPLDDSPAAGRTAPCFLEDDLSDLGRMRAAFLARRGELRAALGELRSSLLAASGSAVPPRNVDCQEFSAWLEDLAGQPYRP